MMKSSISMIFDSRTLALTFPQADTCPSTILVDELNARLFEGTPHIFERTRIWLPCTAFKVRDGLRGRFACL